MHVKTKRKILAIATLVILLIGTGAWYYVFVWSEHHHRNVQDEKGIVINAQTLLDAFAKNEQAANAAYLDKVLEVTGTVSDIKVNQEGKQTIVLETNNVMAGIICTLRNTDNAIKEHTAITIKGICTGYLSDVVIIDAVVLKNSALVNN